MIIFVAETTLDRHAPYAPMPPTLRSHSLICPDGFEIARGRGDLTQAALEKAAGASVRTLQRLFAAETGPRLSAWRRAARPLQTTALLPEGARVTEAGLAVGYASPGAFTSAYRRGAGRTPREVRRSAAAERRMKGG